MSEPEISLTTPPEPTNITLLFKQRKSTTLLFASSTTPISSLRQLLHAALKSRDVDVPSSAEDIEFGILKDPSVGKTIGKDQPPEWRLVGGETGEDTDSGEVGKKEKKKGRPSSMNARAGAGKDRGEETPQSLGLGDGGIVAYRFRRGRDDEPVASVEDEEMEVDEDEWDVVMPSFDDEYDERQAAAAEEAALQDAMNGTNR
jgi:hypothetical protein